MYFSRPPCCPGTLVAGGPQVGPSLTAAARDGRTIVRAGMEEWLPNKRMTPGRKVKYHQTRYPDPKPSTVHQNRGKFIMGLERSMIGTFG